MKEYQWKAGARIKADPETVGRLFDRLDETVGLNAENVLDSARDENSPIHNEFEWNDTDAAEMYRLSQARHLINCLTVKIIERDDAAPVRAYFKISDDNYEQTKNIIKVEEKRRSLLEQALSELRTFQRKYSILKELAEVFAEIDKANRKNEESA